MMLALVLDVLLPGDADYPAASATGLADRMQAYSRFVPTVAPLLSRLPADFAALSPPDRIAAITQVETTEPALFAAFLTGVYSLYYTAPETAAVIAAQTDHRAAPPQPGGHVLPAFHPAMVSLPASRAPHYRPTPKVPNV